MADDDEVRDATTGKVIRFADLQRMAETDPWIRALINHRIAYLAAMERAVHDRIEKVLNRRVTMENGHGLIVLHIFCWLHNIAFHSTPGSYYACPWHGSDRFDVEADD